MPLTLECEGRAPSPCACFLRRSCRLAACAAPASGSPRLDCMRPAAYRTAYLPCRSHKQGAGFPCGRPQAPAGRANSAGLRRAAPCMPQACSAAGRPGPTSGARASVLRRGPLGSRMPGVLYLNFSTVGARGGSLRLAVPRPNTQDPAGPALQASPGSGQGVEWGEWGVGDEGRLRGRRLSMYFSASGPSFARSAGGWQQGPGCQASALQLFRKGGPGPRLNRPQPAAHAQPCSACISSSASARGCL